jgi:hypothetical protein
MKKTRSFLSRYRLIINVLALVFVLSTFAGPAAADDEIVIEGPICATGCTNWNQQQGCIYCERCCSGGPYAYTCYKIDNSFCP